MSQEQFEAFREKVLNRTELQVELRNLQDHDLFMERVVQLGSIHGYTFTSAEVAAALQASRRAWLERSR